MRVYRSFKARAVHRILAFSKGPQLKGQLKPKIGKNFSYASGYEILEDGVLDFRIVPD